MTPEPTSPIHALQVVRPFPRSVKISIVCILFAVISVLSAAEPTKPFTLTIVPTSSGADVRTISTAKKQPHLFYIILTNVSDQPQPTWETWCSWGFWTISFEFTLPDGKHISVIKNRNEGFTMNFPATFLVPSGEQQVYPIRLDSEWDNRPTFDKAENTPVTVKAIYTVAPTAESTKYKVWTGHIDSPSYNFVLTHW